MYEKLFYFILILFIFYTLIPFLYSRVLGMGVFKNNRKSNNIAFTFDDGPHPVYTAEVLDVLRDHHIKAAFFVLGSSAEKYPELILRMHNEGHLIGIHNYVHHSNWIMAPWKIRKDLDRSAAIIEGITGKKPHYYRPPWGLLNIFDFFILKDYKIILWSLMAGDWRSRGGSERVRNVLLTKVKQGDIILLHDSGDTLGADEEAPQNTISALKDVLKEVSLRGYTCVRIDELFYSQHQNNNIKLQ